MIFFILLLFSHLLFSNDCDFPNFYDTDNICILYQQEAQYCYFSIIKNNASHKKYCIKQVKERAYWKEYSFVHEVVASFVAESIRLPINKVRLIPAYIPFPGKLFLDKLATIHTFAEGKQIKYLKKPYEDLILKQGQKKIIWGLTKTIIERMSIHPDLAKITALDVFIGNYDRSGSNLFYDQQMDRFFGIDLERSFYVDLAQYACNNFKKMINDGITFTKQEIYGIKIFKETIEQLYENNPPEKIALQLEQFYKKIMRLHEKQRTYQYKNSLRNIVNKRIEICKLNIIKNYQSTESFIKILNDFLSHQEI